MLRTAVLALALALVAALPTTAQPAAPAAVSPPSSWRLFRYPELHLMFRAPADFHPKVTSKMSPSGGDMVPEHQVVVIDAGDWAWVISVGDLTATSFTINIDGVPPGAAAGFGGRIVGSVRTISVPGAEQAREYDAASDKVVARSRVLLQSRRLYQGMTISTGTVLPANTDAFLASITPLP